ncbi:MAG: enoyl-CoA hydratase/isomerase family protein [Alphaproteobacteria bacterium]|nr:enoyl-CoA hydratase/isomerase family protein [Alphaproteobacteria bacterium]
MSHLIVDRRGEALWITIDRPAKRNALSRAVLAEIRAVFEAEARDGTIKVVVLTGTGDKCFAAGGDLKELEGVREAEAARRFSVEAKAALQAVRDFPAPVIARLNGDALGGGAELALACDLRAMAAHARLGFLQAKLAVTTGWGGGYDLMRRVGTSTALRLLGRAEILTAAKALALGLADAADDDADAAVDGLLTPMLAQSAHVLRGFKAIAGAHDRQLRSAVDQVETEAFVAAWVHPDHWAAAAKALKPKGLKKG